MTIVLEKLTKRYNGHPVVNNVSLEIADGEFFVLLGSSGSGKTTVLTMIAGLTEIDAGRIFLHGRDVTFLPAQERRVGFVFQNYALFQHMSAAENIEFGLRVRKTPAAERRRRRDELLELVGLTGLGNRMPRQLSGGQQQRVALARALAHQPEVLLLDEPLGALDAKIRMELRRTLRAIQRELGITTILVTHDQEEAFELADRLGVMSFGRLLEVGPPEKLYQYPQTEFVATFLGTANLLLGQATATGVKIGAHQFPLEWEPTAPVPAQLDGTEQVQILFRPESVVLAKSAQALPAPPLGPGEVEQITFGGAYQRLHLRLAPIAGVRPISPPVTFGGDALVIEATRSLEESRRLPLEPGDSVWVGVNCIHTLAHPGLRLLILSDGSPAAQAALAMSSQLARLAHARVTLIVYKLTGDALQAHVQKVKEQFGSGLPAFEIRTTEAEPDVTEPDVVVAREVERLPVDLVVIGNGGQSSVALAERLLQWGEHNLLLVPNAQSAPTQVLICVASGEPGKEDVLFTGRLAYHLGAAATLLCVIPGSQETPDARARAERFLTHGARTLEFLGVPSRTVLRVGPVQDEILRELQSQPYDLLVLGMPLPNHEGRVWLNGLVGQLVRTIRNRPLLLVRSHRRYPSAPARFPTARSRTIKEMA
ncbi:MAG TPA: ATP-binding cassette domain-containing protein [Caldilineaceae bacterium]|nr:ATP-binding cassette domain-containing protein [Caldilineaceae bacterium]